MTDTETPSDKKRRGERDRSQVEPVAKDQAFFEWLEKLFYDEPEPAHFPERLELRIVTGKHREKFGPLIKQLVFAPAKATEETIKAGAGRRKPTKEELVALSNELLFRMQKDCDESRQQVCYGVHVWHYSRGDEPYERYLKFVKPQGRYSKDEGHASDDDEEPKSLQERFGIQILGHQERLFGLYGGGFEGLLDRMDRILERQDLRIEKQDQRIEKLNEMLERALSHEAEREEKRMWAQLKIKGADRALEMATTLAPPLINQLVGKPIIPTNETAETIALKNFFKRQENGGSLTTEQSNAAFGTYDENPPHDLIKPGVLSYEQAKILLDVAECRIPPDELDKLMPGGALAVTPEQAAALAQIFSIEQLAPIMLIFESRNRRRAPVQ